MIRIEKKREPRALSEYRKLPYASYEGMHGASTGRDNGEDVYHVVLDSLIKEQGCLCAYCMRTIPEKRGTPAATIEHIIPQSKDPEKALSYQNRELNEVLNLNCEERNLIISHGLFNH